MQVNADVDLRCVAPDVVPDVVGKDVGSTATELGRHTREDAVHVGEGAGCAGCEVVALVEVDSHWVDSGDTDHCRTQLPSSNLKT